MLSNLLDDPRSAELLVYCRHASMANWGAVLFCGGLTDCMYKHLSWSPLSSAVVQLNVDMYLQFLQALEHRHFPILKVIVLGRSQSEFVCVSHHSL